MSDPITPVSFTTPAAAPAAAPTPPVPRTSPDDDSKGREVASGPKPAPQPALEVDHNVETPPAATAEVKNNEQTAPGATNFGGESQKHVVNLVA